MLKSLLKISFGLFYGAVIAGAYLIAKLVGSNGGMNVACVSALILFIIHCIAWPKLSLKALVNWHYMFRAILFGVTQIFLFKAQSYGSTSSMLIAGIAGALVGSALGRLILKEIPNWLDLLAILIGVAGIIVGNENIGVNMWAITGGAIQGLTAVTARSLMKRGASRRAAVASGFFVLFLTSLFMLIISGDLPSIRTLTIPGIVAATLVVTLSQYAFFQLYKLYDTQKAAIISLLRVPWAVVLELIVIGTLISTTKIISSAIIILAAAVSLIHHARKVRHDGVTT